jgi:hypothetical protein
MGNFIRDYVIIIPTIIAVLNGFAAVLVANFFKDNLMAKLILVGIVGMLSVAAVAATLYGQYQVIAQREATAQHRRQVREALGSFLEEGRQLMIRCANETIPPPTADAEAWAQRVETYLHQNLDDSYIGRFRTGAGLPLAANSIQSIPHRNLWSGINIRISRLAEYIKEIGP